jgi:putative ABC transport system permease protein
MRGTIQDLRYAIRQLGRTRTFAVLAVLTLGLGIGVHVAFLGIVNAVIARIIPVSRSDGVYLVSLQETRTQAVLGIPSDQFRTVEQNPPESVAATAAVGSRERVTVSAPGHADSVLAEPVTGQYARVFDLHTQAGRWLGPEDDRAGSAPAAVISDRLWRDWFAADPGTTGRGVININRKPFNVVGVASARFRGVTAGFDTPDVWIAESTLPSLYPTRGTQWLTGHSLTMFVKSRYGAAPAEIRDRIQPVVRGGWSGKIEFPAAVIVTPAQTALERSVSVLKRVVFSFSGLVLLAACANLANMLYARGTQREGELAVRLSLGANPARILRLLLAEAGVLGLLAGGVGLAIAVGATRIFGLAFPRFLVDRTHSVSLDLSPDYRVFLAALGSGLAAALLVGTMTAFRATRVAPLRALASAGAACGVTRRARLRTVFVAVQVTVALILVMGAGLFLENPPQNLDLDKRLNFDASRMATAGVDLSLHGYDESSGRLFFDRLLTGARKIPGVESAALASAVPGGVDQAEAEVSPLIAEDSATRPTGNPRRIRASVAIVSPALTDTLELPLRRGRQFTQWDAEGAPLVAIVTESTAAALYPQKEAVGRRVQLGFGGPWLIIVAIVADPIAGASDAGVFARPSNFIFVPAAQHYKPRMLVVIRSAAPAAKIDPLRAAILGIDNQVALYRASTLEEAFLAWAAPVRAANLLMTTLGLLAMTIAMLGVYGVIDYFVATRSREFGIRLALGATPRKLIKMVLDQAIHVILVGLLCGVLITTLGSRLIENSIIRVVRTSWRRG